MERQLFFILSGYSRVRMAARDGKLNIIELIVHTSCYCILDLLCVNMMTEIQADFFSGVKQRLGVNQHLRVTPKRW